jgi:hypothetical protein
MTLKAIEAEKLSLPLLDLIDITHENSMLLENKADKSIKFASIQANKNILNFLKELNQLKINFV